MQTIALIDYGMGNLHSVSRALRTVAPEAKLVLTNSPEEILNADRIIFPGQGAMPDGMRHLREHGLDTLLRKTCTNKPFLGICLGLQMLFEYSEEGPTDGLGLFKGHVAHLKTIQPPVNKPLKIPHMGWNQVHIRHPEHLLWRDIPQDSHFYFVHSYYAVPNSDEDTATITHYPSPFVSAVIRKNVVAVQFHPEKSQTPGLQFLKNFVQWMPLDVQTPDVSLSAQ